MPKLFAVFFKTEHARPWLVIAALLAATFAEGVGFATLLPLITVAADTGETPASPLHDVVRDALALLGLAPELGTLLVVVVSILVLRSLLRMIAARYVGNTTAEIATAVRRRLIYGLLKVRWRFLVGQPLGRIANVMSSEANRAGRAYTTVAELISNLIQAVIFAAISFLVSWRLALAAMLVAGGIAAGLHVFVRISRRAGRKQTKRTKELLVFLADTLANLKPVRAMGKERAFAHLLEDRIVRLRRSMRQVVFAREALNNLQDIVVAVLLGVGFWVAHTIWRIQVAELIVTGLLLYRAVAAVGKVQKSHQLAVELESAYLHAERLVREAQADPEPNPGRRTPTLEKGVALERVHFAYGEVPVLRGVSLEVPAGAMVVLTGASGSGKTTIVDLLLGLHRPTSGHVRVDGLSLEEIDLARWRALVGYVPQELILFHDTVLTNVTLGDPSIDEAAARRALELAGGAEFVEALPEGLATVVGEKGARLSGGQRQRIALARAIASSPRLLILDEVTSALDPATAADIVRNIKSLTGRMTVLAITHRPELLDIADRVYRIEAGTAVLEPVRAPEFRVAPAR